MWWLRQVLAQLSAIKRILAKELKLEASSRPGRSRHELASAAEQRGQHCSR
jgi:hypothetical protein